MEAREIRRLEASQMGVIQSVSFSPDGRYLLTGESRSDQSCLRLWDIENGTQIIRLDGHSGAVFYVTVSPESDLGYSCSADKTIRIWDLKTGREIRRLEGHTKCVYSIALAPDGHSILSGSGDGTVRLWDISKGEEIRRFEGHINPVMSVAFFRNGKLALSGSGVKYAKTGGQWGQLLVGSATFLDESVETRNGNDCTIRVWDVNTGREIYSFKGFSQTVLKVEFHPSGEYVLSGSQDKTVRLLQIRDTHED